MATNSPAAATPASDGLEIDHTRSNGLFIGAAIIGGVALVVLLAGQIFATIVSGLATALLLYTASRVRLDEGADGGNEKRRHEAPEPTWGDTSDAASNGYVSPNGFTAPKGHGVPPSSAVPEPELVVLAKSPAPTAPGPVEVVKAALPPEPRAAAPLPRRR